MERLSIDQVSWAVVADQIPDLLVDCEWLVTNGLGGYASGSILGMRTRRFHGLLIAALPAPLGRTMMLNHLVEEIRLPDGSLALLADDGTPAESRPGMRQATLSQFRLEGGLPVWRYELDSLALEKRVFMPYRGNTVHIMYQLVSAGGAIQLWLRPAVNFRPHDAPVAMQSPQPLPVVALGDRFEIGDPKTLLLRLHLHGSKAEMVLDGGRFVEFFYRMEHSRGYDSSGTLWSPGHFQFNLATNEPATLIASTDSWDEIQAIEPVAALDAELQRRQRLLDQADRGNLDPLAAQWVLASDQFIIAPTVRVADTARAHASGDDVRTVIAGYHWFTDWGRDTMISLEGLALCTGRNEEAGYILRTFAHYVRDGLIPNLFPEGQNEGLYHTADATLWYFHAIDRYLLATGDRATLKLLLPVLQDIVEHHLRGTRFGIHVDPSDGLLAQGAEGYQLTWMDAKVGDWVVTPRRGKAVELNALWYNALRLMQGWLAEAQETNVSEAMARHAQRAFESFNAKFWYEDGRYLYDLIDTQQGVDRSVRPNQIFAISLPHSVLDRSRWSDVLRVVMERLLTPVGLRSLAPGDPQYKPRYDGDLRSRDAAYHQGTVWAWLIGPFVDAWIKVHPEQSRAARDFLSGFSKHLGEACVGSISEIFDAEPPFTPRGCIAQAWSVAEVLRAWLKTTQ